MTSRPSGALAALLVGATLVGCAALNADFPDSNVPSEPPACTEAKGWIIVDTLVTVLAVTAAVGSDSSLDSPKFYTPAAMGLIFGASAVLGTTSVIKCKRARKTHKEWLIANQTEMQKQQQSLKAELERLQQATERRENEIRQNESLQVDQESETQNQDVKQCRSGEMSLPACKQRASEYTRAGMKAFDDGDYDSAIEAYTNAHDIIPHPLLLYNRADSYRKRAEAMRPTLRSAAEFNAYRQFLGRSLNDYSIYLQTVTDPQRHRYIKDVITELTQEIVRANAEVDKLDTAPAPVPVPVPVPVP